MRPMSQLIRKLAPLCAVLFPVSLLARRYLGSPGGTWGQTALLVEGAASLATLSPQP